MARYQKFEELPAWQEAARLYNAVSDVLEAPGSPFSVGFRDQLDRAALSVSNDIAEGFERTTTVELLQFLGIARGSAGEVRSLMAVVTNRPKMKPLPGKRHLTPVAREHRQVAVKAMEFRLNFLRSLKPEHPLYNSPEANAARG